MQRPAKPWTPVRFRPQPPITYNTFFSSKRCKQDHPEVARVAKLVDARDLKSLGAKHRVGSSPTPGTMISGNSSAGRAQPCQGWGREFESRFPLQSLFPSFSPTYPTALHRA